jgi:hypothetical protein
MCVTFAGRSGLLGGSAAVLRGPPVVGEWPVGFRGRRRALLQHFLVSLSKLVAGIDPEFLSESVAEALIEGDCLGLLSDGGECQQQPGLY